MPDTTVADAPAADKPEPPKSIFEKAGAALPIALTALATALAGMSTGELQKSMYWRSYAAQDQARATSQWTLAGFKRDRSLTCQTAAATLRAIAGEAGANPFGSSAGSVKPPEGADPRALEWLAGAGPPKTSLPEVSDAGLKQLLSDIQKRLPESELNREAAKISAETIGRAIDEAEAFVEDLDKQWGPTVKSAAALAAAPGKTSPAAQAAGYELENRRYRAESSLNQGVGYLYEARTKVSGAQSEKHQRKSRNFFYAMLAAQVGATVSALALARKKQSVLWAVAGGTGLVAIAIGAYVFLSEA